MTTRALLTVAWARVRVELGLGLGSALGLGLVSAVVASMTGSESGVWLGLGVD